MAGYEVVRENPGGSHARTTMIDNTWRVTCRTCGTWDVAGAGHPAVRHRGDGTHELHDRTALRHEHADGCVPDTETGHYPLDFALAGAPAPVRGPGRLPLGLLGMQLMMLRALALWRLAMAAAGMTDRTLVAHIMDNILHTTTASTFTAGTGGTTIAFTLPLKLRLFTITGTETGTGTEQTGTNGYTTGGTAFTGAAFGANASGISTGPGTQVQWTASGTWANATNGLEIFDSSGTPLRILWGALTAAIAANAVVNLDTVTVAVNALSADASTW